MKYVNVHPSHFVNGGWSANMCACIFLVGGCHSSPLPSSSLFFLSTDYIVAPMRPPLLPSSPRLHTNERRYGWTQNNNILQFSGRKCFSDADDPFVWLENFRGTERFCLPFSDFPPFLSNFSEGKYRFFLLKEGGGRSRQRMG